MTYPTFKDWRDDKLCLNNEGEVSHVYHAPLEKKDYVVPVCFDQFEDLWDYWEEKTDKTKDLLNELGEEMVEPLNLLIENYKNATDQYSVELCNKVARIRRILKVVGCKDYI